MQPKCIGCGAEDRFMCQVSELERRNEPDGPVVGIERVLLVMCKDCGVVSAAVPHHELPEGPISMEEQKAELEQLETTLETGLGIGGNPEETT